MTHTLFGKYADGKSGRLVQVGAPENEDEAREFAKGSHPDFLVELIVPGDVAKRPDETPVNPKASS